MPKLMVHLDSDGATLITSKQLPQVKAGTSGTAKKFGKQNVGDVVLIGLQHQIKQAGTGDGYLFTQFAFDTVTLSPPWGFAAAVAPTGGSWGASLGIKYYVITALNGLGETFKSLQVSATVAAAANRVDVSWQAVPGATGYKLYRSTSSGSFLTPSLVATLGSGATSYSDTGSAVSAGAPPPDNTTGGAAPAYGTPPVTFQTTPLVIGTLPIGKTIFYWARKVVPLGTTSTGNTRKTILEPVEV